MNLATEQRAELETWVRRGATLRKQAQRAEMILLTADGVPSSEIVRRVRTSYPTLTRWRKRFDEAGVEGLRQGKTRSPGIAPLPQANLFFQVVARRYERGAIVLTSNLPFAQWSTALADDSTLTASATPQSESPTLSLDRQGIRYPR